MNVMPQPTDAGKRWSHVDHPDAGAVDRDARLNEAMTRVLRDAAEEREELERARRTKDSRLAKGQSAACLRLVSGIDPSGGDHGLWLGSDRHRPGRALLEPR